MKRSNEESAVDDDKNNKKVKIDGGLSDILKLILADEKACDECVASNKALETCMHKECAICSVNVPPCQMACTPCHHLLCLICINKCVKKERGPVVKCPFCRKPCNEYYHTDENQPSGIVTEKITPPRPRRNRWSPPIPIPGMGMLFTLQVRSRAGENDDDDDDDDDDDEEEEDADDADSNGNLAGFVVPDDVIDGRRTRAPTEPSILDILWELSYRTAVQMNASMTRVTRAQRRQQITTRSQTAAQQQRSPSI